METGPDLKLSGSRPTLSYIHKHTITNEIKGKKKKNLKETEEDMDSPFLHSLPLSEIGRRSTVQVAR